MIFSVHFGAKQNNFATLLKQEKKKTKKKGKKRKGKGKGK